MTGPLAGGAGARELLGAGCARLTLRVGLGRAGLPDRVGAGWRRRAGRRRAGRGARRRDRAVAAVRRRCSGRATCRRRQDGAPQADGADSRAHWHPATHPATVAGEARVRVLSRVSAMPMSLRLRAQSPRSVTPASSSRGGTGAGWRSGELAGRPGIRDRRLLRARGGPGIAAAVRAALGARGASFGTPGRAEFVRLVRGRRPLTLRSASGAVRGLRSLSYGLALLYYGRIVRLSFCEWLDWASQANGSYQRDMWALTSVARSAHELALERIRASRWTPAPALCFSCVTSTRSTSTTTT